jgi:hypothetical protein
MAPARERLFNALDRHATAGLAHAVWLRTSEEGAGGSNMDGKSRLILSMVMSSVMVLMVLLYAFPYRIQHAVPHRINDAAIRALTSAFPPTAA